MKWLVAIFGVAVVGYFVWRTKSGQTPANVTQALSSQRPVSPRPEPAPQVSSPSLCQGLVTVGGTAGGIYFGAPPQLSAPLSAGLSKPVCAMGAVVSKAIIPVVKNTANIVGGTTKAIGYSIPKAGLYAGVDAGKNLFNKTLAVGASVTNPKAFVGANVNLAKTVVTTPVKIGGAVLKKADPRKWF